MNRNTLQPFSKCLLGLVGALVLLALATMAFGYSGTVGKVHDGDTVSVDGVTVRLSQIDAPELGQPGGFASRDYLAGLVLGQSVEVLPLQERDVHGRLVAGLLVNGRSVQGAMVEAGHAWVYTSYCRKCDDLKRLETEAREARRGLWADPDPVPPWEWRKHKKEVRL